MKLLTKDIINKVPKLYETEHLALEDRVVHAKFFTPWSNWTWYLIEFDGEDRCFGFVKGHEAEFGFFTMSELSSLEGPFGLKVERDKFFTPTRVCELPRW